MVNRDLTPWRGGGISPYGRDPFGDFRRQMDRLFEDFFAPATAEPRSFAGPGQAQTMVRPSIDVEETDEAYKVTVEVPGIAEKDIELNLQDNALTISGEKKSERNEEEKGRRYTERSYGRFSRTIPFEAEVDPDNVQASCRNGVLHINLPKNPKARETSRRIEIKPQAGGDGGTAATQAGQVP